MTEIFKRGEQIAYVPWHARRSDGDWDHSHPDVELGFVTSQRGSTVFCRYWRTGRVGCLRTMANSEATSASDLVRYQSAPDDLVQETLRWIEKSGE